MQNIRVAINPSGPTERAFHPNYIHLILDLGQHKDLLPFGIVILFNGLVQLPARELKLPQIIKSPPPLIPIFKFIREGRSMAILEKPSKFILFYNHGSLNLQEIF